jgi:hypothetical protein
MSLPFSSIWEHLVYFLVNTVICVPPLHHFTHTSEKFVQTSAVMYKQVRSFLAGALKSTFNGEVWMKRKKIRLGHPYDIIVMLTAIGTVGDLCKRASRYYLSYS